MKKGNHFIGKMLAMLVAVTMLSTIFVSTTASAATLSGTLSMDTRSYTMAPGKIYDFRAKLTGTGVNQADVKVYSSRDAVALITRNSGSDTYRVTAKKAGVTYVTAEAYGVHASIKITVTPGVKGHGEACRATSVIGTRYTAGKYEIGYGKDLPAGDYILFPTSASKEGYFEVHKDNTDNLIPFENFNGRTRITLAEDEDLTFKDAIMCPISEAPKLDLSNGVLSDGTYKVGEDIPAGKYKVHPTDSITPGYYSIYPDGTHLIGLNTIVSNDLFTKDVYVTLQDGQYFELSLAQMYLTTN